MLDNALEYIAGGWSIIPVQRGKKIPYVPWTEFQSRVPTKAEVRGWWEKWPDANIGLITGKVSGIVVVDIDTPFASVAGHDPTALISRTGRGFHLFYKHPGDGERVKLQAKAGTDVRGDGGLIILPPSVHKSGSRYEWMLQGKPSPMPEWVSRMSESNSATALPDTTKDTFSIPPEGKSPWLARAWSGDIPDGEGNITLAKMVGQIAGLGQPVDVTMAMLGGWNKALRDPMKTRDIESTVRSVYATERRRHPKTVEITKAPAEPQSGVFDLLTYDEYMREYLDVEESWDIEGWLPQSTIAMLIAPPGSYKTWFEFDIAITMSTGTPFMDGTIPGRTGPVIVCQQEDKPQDVAKRIFGMQCVRSGLAKAYEDTPGSWVVEMPKSAPIHFHRDMRLNLQDLEVLGVLDRHIERIGAIAVMGDPLYSIVPTEDHMAQAARLMLRPKRMRNERNCSFIFAHHTTKSSRGKRGRERMHGSNLLLGSMESFLEIHKLGPEDLPIVVVEAHSKSEKGMGCRMVEFDIDLPSNVYNPVVSALSGSMFNDILEADENGTITKDQIEKITSGPSAPIRRQAKHGSDLSRYARQVLGVLLQGSSNAAKIQMALKTTARVVDNAIAELIRANLAKNSGGRIAINDAVHKKS